MEENNKNNFKKLSFWLSLICCVLVVVQIVLSYFNAKFELKIVVEIISLVLAVLVSFGVLSSTKDKNVLEIREDIKNEINSQLNNNQFDDDQNKELSQEDLKE